MKDTPQCTYQDCTKKDTCYRFNVPENKKHDSEVLFQNICNERNDYKMYWHMNLEIVPVDQGAEKESE
jgi:hypothetical protein